MSKPRPHDALFHDVFSRPELAADLIRRSLPPPVVAALDLERMERVNAHSIDERLRTRQADLVFRVPLRARRSVAFVCVLMEHQSTPHPLMAYRLMAYTVGAWKDFIDAYRAEHRRPPTRLPAVIPIVVYQGRHPWRTARRLTEVIDLPPALRAELGDHLPELHLLIDDLYLTDDAAIERSAARALTAAALMTMRYVRREDDPDGFLARWLGRIRAALHEPGGRELVETIAQYLYDESERIGAEQLVEAVEAATPDDKEAMVTLTDKLIEMGRREGIEKGIEKGTGRTLLKLIRLKFGEPAPHVVERVGAAGTDDLDRWTARILTAETLAELFDDR